MLTGWWMSAERAGRAGGCGTRKTPCLNTFVHGFAFRVSTPPLGLTCDGLQVHTLTRGSGMRNSWSVRVGPSTGCSISLANTIHDSPPLYTYPRLDFPHRLPTTNSPPNYKKCGPQRHLGFGAWLVAHHRRLTSGSLNKKMHL